MSGNSFLERCHLATATSHEPIEALSVLLRAANAGDGSCYRLFLERLAPLIRAMAHRHLSRIGTPSADVEDVVQETLLAVHLKRHTWQQDQPIGPWIAAITRYKLIDFARRHGRRKEVEMDEGFDWAAPDSDVPLIAEHDINRLFAQINATQRTIVHAISIAGASIREVAEQLDMSEGAVRVALHRGLKALGAAYRKLDT